MAGSEGQVTGLRSRLGHLRPGRGGTIEAGLLVLLVGGLAKVVVLTRDLVLAPVFGLGDEVDAFVVAFAVPTFVMLVIGESFNVALVPSLVRAQRRGGDHQGTTLASVVRDSLPLLVGVTVLLLLSAPLVVWALAGDFPPDKRSLTTSLYLALVLTIPMAGTSSLWAAALTARRRFAVATLAPSLVPLGVTVLALVVGTRWGAAALAVGAILGSVAQMVVLAVALHRQGLSPRPRRAPHSNEVARTMSQYRPLVVAAALTGFASLVDQAIASRLGAGSVAALTFGTRLGNFVFALGFTALGTVSLPHFSHLATGGEWQRLRSDTARTCRLVLAGVGAITLVLVATSRPIITTFFQSGAFDADDTSLTYRIQVMHLVQLPVALVGVLLRRLAAVLELSSALVRSSWLFLGATVAFDVALSRWLGVAGIALASAPAHACAAAVLAVHIRRRVKELTS